MMTNSQKSFVKVKLWFSKLVNHSHSEQMAEIKHLHADGTIDEDQVKLLKEMLQADSQTGMETSISGEVVSEVTSDNQILDQQIGPYKIIKAIGEGGMGQVYLAERNDGVFEQQVALKLPHSNFNPQMLQHFENERQILAQLTHNNIAHLLDGGTTQNNQPYLVMEYIQGKNIDDYCIENIPNLHERLKLILQICSAVTFSHQQLVLHRDLKPSNILVTNDGLVKLLDFGIAKLLDIDEETKAKNTATQIMTRYYASPEQLQGNPASTHSDLFSLAIIAYELITGYHPFQHETQHEREKNLISGKIMRVTQRTDDNEALLPELAKIPSGKLQGDLENILLKALSVDPDKRYDSVKDFANDLNNYIDNKPVTARKPSYFYILSKLIQRNKTVSLAILLSLFTLIGSTIYSLNKARIAELENQKSKTIASFLQKIFQKAQPAEGADEVMAVDLLSNAMDELKNNTKIDKEVRFELMVIIFRSYTLLGKSENLREAIKGTYTQCKKELSESISDCQMILIYKAHLEHITGNDKKCVEIYQQAEGIERQFAANGKMFLAKILNNQMSCLLNIRKYDSAIAKNKEILSIYQQDPTTNPQFKYSIINDLAHIYIQLQDFQKAKENIEIIDKYLQDEKLTKTSRMASQDQLWSAYYSAQHLPVESLKYRAHSILIINSLYKVKPTILGFYLMGYSYALFRTGDLSESLKVNKIASEFYQNNSNGKFNKQINILVKKAIIYQALEKIDDANNTMNSVYALGIEYLSDKYDDVCYYKLAKAQVSITNLSVQQAQENIDNFSECKNLDKNTNDVFSANWHALNAQLSGKKGEVDDAFASINNAMLILEKYPNDYIGFKHYFDRVKSAINKKLK